VGTLHSEEEDIFSGYQDYIIEMASQKMSAVMIIFPNITRIEKQALNARQAINVFDGWFFHVFIISIFLCTLCSSAIVFAASEDDYLKQLELEAEEDEKVDALPAILESGDSANASMDAPTSELELIFDKKQLIIDLASFESSLKANYPESSALYEQLTGEQKKKIYQEFKRHKRLYNSSVQVISVYLSTH
jgi:superfamily II DNA/RNA helicase